MIQTCRYINETTWIQIQSCLSSPHNLPAAVPHNGTKMCLVMLTELQTLYTIS